MKWIPQFASWESTLWCPLSCIHCGVNAGPFACNQRGKELSTSESLAMMDNLYALGVRRFVISGGEFTMRGDWCELLEYALKTFDAVRQITNGMYRGLLKTLGRIPNNDRLTLSVSIDGVPRVHEIIRGRNSSVSPLDIIRAHSPIQRGVITTVMNSNFENLEALFNLLRECEIPVWSIQLGIPAGRMQQSEFIGEERIKKLADMIRSWQIAEPNMEIIPDNCFGYFHPMRENYRWNGCQAGRNFITVLSNGDVTGCPTTDDVICGNIRETPIRDIWNNERMETFRNDRPQCQGCDNSICPGGCRVTRRIFGKQFCF